MARLNIAVHLAEELKIDDDKRAAAASYFETVKQTGTQQVYYQNDAIGLFTTHAVMPQKVLDKCTAYQEALKQRKALSEDAVEAEKNRLSEKVLLESLTRCTAQMDLKKELRAAACGKLYYDCDIENCGPRIISQIVQAARIDAPLMHQYDTNHEDYLQKAMRDLGINRSAAKDLFTPIFNLAGMPALKRVLVSIGKPVDFKCQSITFRNRLVQEFRAVGDQLAKMDFMKPYLHHARAKKKPLVEGSALAFLTRTIQKRMLIVLKKTFEETEYDVGSLVNDGLHVRSKYAAARDLGPAPTAGLLASCEEAVLEATGFWIKLKIKEFEVPRIVADAYNNVYVFTQLGTVRL